jgi:hypothetical protein
MAVCSLMACIWRRSDVIILVVYLRSFYLNISLLLLMHLWRRLLYLHWCSRLTLREIILSWLSISDSLLFWIRLMLIGVYILLLRFMYILHNFFIIIVWLIHHMIILIHIGLLKGFLLGHLNAFLIVSSVDCWEWSFSIFMLLLNYRYAI